MVETKTHDTQLINVVQTGLKIFVTVTVTLIITLTISAFSVYTGFIELREEVKHLTASMNGNVTRDVKDHETMKVDIKDLEIQVDGVRDDIHTLKLDVYKGGNG